MSSIEITKIVGVLLTVALVVALSNFIANEIIPRHPDEVRAYAVVAAEAETEDAEPEESESEATAAAEDAPAEAVSGVAALLAAADPAAGQKAIKKCTACHSMDKGGRQKIGPNLWDLIDRPVASVAGYTYSSALKDKSGEIWSYDNLDAFLAKPKDWAPGTKMSFAGIKKPEQRADLIVYMRDLSDDPAALPE